MSMCVCVYMGQLDMCVHMYILVLCIYLHGKFKNHNKKFRKCRNLHTSSKLYIIIQTFTQSYTIKTDIYTIRHNQSKIHIMIIDIRCLIHAFYVIESNISIINTDFLHHESKLLPMMTDIYMINTNIYTSNTDILHNQVKYLHIL
jgi:hypothetical protein